MNSGGVINTLVCGFPAGRDLSLHTLLPTLPAHPCPHILLPTPAPLCYRVGVIEEGPCHQAARIDLVLCPRDINEWGATLCLGLVIHVAAPTGLTGQLEVNVTADVPGGIKWEGKVWVKHSRLEYSRAVAIHPPFFTIPVYPPVVIPRQRTAGGSGTCR